MTIKANNEEIEVQEYSFAALAAKTQEGVEEFTFAAIDPSKLVSPTIKQEQLKVERSHAKERQFLISDIVQQHRGIAQQEQEEIEAYINAEVQKRFEAKVEEGYQKGFEEGLEQGRKELFEQTKTATEEKLELLTEMITSVLATRADILNKQKNQIFEMIKNLVKWITLKELHEDGKYAERLFEKLINEIDSKSNLLVQVNREVAEQMPDIIEVVQAKLGEMKNVRVEVDFDIPDGGMIIESDNGIINGTLEKQLESLDKLFESVGVYESE